MTVAPPSVVTLVRNVLCREFIEKSQMLPSSLDRDFAGRPPVSPGTAELFNGLQRDAALAFPVTMKMMHRTVTPADGETF
jgi:hypothetical protein